MSDRNQQNCEVRSERKTSRNVIVESCIRTEVVSCRALDRMQHLGGVDWSLVESALDNEHTNLELDSRHLTPDHVASRHITLCHFMSLYVTSCHFMSLYVTLCHFMSLYVMPRHATSCHVMSRHVTSCHVTSRHGTARYVKSRQVTSRHVTSRHMSRHVTSRLVTSFHVMSRKTNHDTIWHFKDKDEGRWLKMLKIHKHSLGRRRTVTRPTH